MYYLNIYIYICLCVYISGTIKLTLHLLDFRCVFLAHLSKNIKKCKAARATKKTATASSSLCCIVAFVVKKPRRKVNWSPWTQTKKMEIQVGIVGVGFVDSLRRWCKGCLAKTKLAISQSGTWCDLAAAISLKVREVIFKKHHLILYPF